MNDRVLLKYFCLFIIFLFCISCYKEVEIKTERVEETEESLEQSSGELEDMEERPIIKVNKDDELIITVRYDYEPFMWVVDNEFKGFYVDVEKAILEQMGQKYIFVEFTNAEKATMEVKDGTIHAAVASPITQDFLKIFNFADSYITLDLITLVHSDTDDIGGNTPEEVIQSLFGKTVGVQSRGIEYNLLREYREINIVEYETGTVALEKLANKEVDAKVENKEIALHYANKYNWDIKPVGVPLHSMVVAMLFSKRVDPEIIDRYNMALHKVKQDGTYNEIYTRWFGQ